MQSFKETTCDFSMNYGVSPDVCTSIVFSENHKSKCQRMLEIKRMKCAKQSASKKHRIPKEKLMTHEQWQERQAKCKKDKPMTEEEMLKCAKKFNEISLKHHHKKCPFMTKLQTVLEMSDEHKESAVLECSSGGFDELMLKCIHKNVFPDGCEEDEEGMSTDTSDCFSEDGEPRTKVAKTHTDEGETCAREAQASTGETQMHTEDIQARNDEDTAETNEACTSPEPSTPSPESSRHTPKKKVPRGLKRLWKQFQAKCELSTMSPLRDCEPVLNYSPGASPTDLPLFI